MALEHIVLGLVVLGGILYAAVIFLGVMAMWPWGLPVLVVLLITAGIFLWIVVERLGNAEDDRYDNKVDN